MTANNLLAAPVLWNTSLGLEPEFWVSRFTAIFGIMLYLAGRSDDGRCKVTLGDEVVDARWGQHHFRTLSGSRNVEAVCFTFVRMGEY